MRLFSRSARLSAIFPAIAIKPRPNDSNISTQHIPTLLAQHLQAPAKRSQHSNAAYRNIVGRNMLPAFGHHVATCCDMLRVENRTSAHAHPQHCCTNLANRLHHATSTNVAWKIWPFSSFSQQHPTRQRFATRRNMVAKRTQHVAPKNVALKCCNRLAGALHDFSDASLALSVFSRALRYPTFFGLVSTRLFQMSSDWLTDLVGCPLIG